jgi:hypothetical protein
MRFIPFLCFCWWREICNVHVITRSRSRRTNDLHTFFQSTSDESFTEEELIQTQLREDRIRKRRNLNLQHWGYERPAYTHKPHPIFPNTFDAVAEDAYHAIRGTILGLQRPDPNRAVNAMHRSVLDYRPTHPFYSSSRILNDEYLESSKSRQKEALPAARMGIEIDGAAYLFSSDDMQFEERSADEGKALRILSLKIAARLARLHEDEHEELQSVAVYYNSLEQTLLASNELRRLKQTSDAMLCRSLDQIDIFSVNQHSLPEYMKRPKKSKDRASSNGVILVVKPTDYNVDSSFYPTIHSDIIENLQSLLLQASASSVPAVVISPRLSELPPLQQYSTTDRFKTGPSGFEQSGYQQSATYGGHEPPVGPTNWLLRDLIPPVYNWVGCSLDLLSGARVARKKRRSIPSVESLIASYGDKQHTGDRSANVWVDNDDSFHFYSRVAWTQSSMDIGHMYHLFAVKETANTNPYPRSAGDATLKTTYEFMGDLKSSLGRPTVSIIKDVLDQWNTVERIDQ